LAAPSTSAFLTSLGADEILDYRTTEPRTLPEFDVVLDAVGTQMRRYRRLLGENGRMVAVTADPLLPGLVGIALSAVHGRRRIRFSQHNPDRADFDDLTAAIAENRLRPTIGHHYTLDEAPQAYAAALRGGMRGKILIESAFTGWHSHPERTGTT